MNNNIQSSMPIDKKIYRLSKKYNYFEGKKAIDILSKLTLEEASIILENPKVRGAIYHIDDTDILREIFRKSPGYVQEMLFNDEHTRNLLMIPRKSLTNKELKENFNKKDYTLYDKDVRQLELFIASIKSEKIYEDIIESKYFKRIITLLSSNQVKKSFFKGIDTVKLFNSIINDSDIYNTKISRKRNIIDVFNKVSNHILLPDDYQNVINDGKTFIRNLSWSRRADKLVLIDDRTLSLFTTPMLEELLSFENIDDEYIKNYMKSDILPKIINSNYDFDKIFSHLLTNNHNSFNGIDYLYFNIILDEIDNKECLKESFLSFVFKLLCRVNHYSLEEENMIKNSIYIKMKSMSITKEEYQKLFSNSSDLKTIFYLKFNKFSYHMNYLEGISSKQLMYLNIKHINQIINNLNLENEDEISNIYAYAIKLYMVFGLERTLKILKGDYGNLNSIFFNNVSRLDVSNIELVKEGKKYIPKNFNDFINFMFANQNDNHFINMISDKNSLLYKNWSYLYNNYFDIKERCHGNITLKKLNVILKELSPERELDDITPNNYKLQENDILNDICLGNKTRYSNKEIYKIVLDIYQKMKLRIESSIPYVKGECSNGYRYEMMMLNDPIAFVLGYKGNCCIRVQDIGHNHLLHALLCRNGRILLIYDENNELVAFSPLKRNGEVLIANSIECLHKKRNEKAIYAFSDAINDIVGISKKSEEEYLKLVCIGTEAYARPNGESFPSNIPMPTIYEKEDSIYGMTDIYHRKLTILYKDKMLELDKIKYGDPKCSYYDPRPEIRCVDFRVNDSDKIDEALKCINSVRYENASIEELEDFVLYRRYGISKCIYNDDWYLVVSFDGNIYGDYLKFNPKALVEFNIAYCELLGISYDDKKDINVKKLELIRRKPF